MESAMIDRYDTFHGNGYNGSSSGRGEGRPFNGQPVTIRGVEYPTEMAAGAALNVSRQAVSSARARGALDTVGLRRKRP